MSRKRRSYQLDFDDVVQRPPSKVFIRQNGLPKRIPQIIVIDSEDESDSKGIKLKNCQLALTLLRQSHRPQMIHGRQKEYMHIINFVEDALKNGANNPLVVSGLPGYGKTLVLKDCLRRLKSMLSFQFLYFNSQNSKSLHQIYRTLLTSIQLPDQYFKGSWVLVLDQIDAWPGRINVQQLLYNLMEVNINSFCNLIIILVSNRVNFKETFEPKVQSRLGASEILFKPYNAQQLMNIIKQRTSLIPQAILKYAIHKFSIKSSDIRCLLKFCGEIVRNYKNSSIKHVTLKDVDDADTTIFGNVTVNMLRQLQNNSKILLVSIYTEIKLQQPAMLMKSYDRAMAKGYSDPSWHNAIKRAKLLQQLKLINMDGYRHMQQDMVVSATLYQSELVEAFKGDKMLETMMEFMVQIQKEKII